MRLSVLLIVVFSALLIACRALPEPIPCSSATDCVAAPCLLEPCVTPDAVDCISSKCRVLHTDPSCPVVSPYSICTLSMIDPILIAVLPSAVFYDACRVEDICDSLPLPTGTERYVCNNDTLVCDPIECPVQDCFVTGSDPATGECTLTPVELPTKPAETDDTCFDAYCDDTQGVPGGLIQSSFFNCNEYLNDPCGLYQCNDMMPFCTLIGTREGTYADNNGILTQCATGDVLSSHIDVSDILLPTPTFNSITSYQTETETSVEVTGDDIAVTQSIDLIISNAIMLEPLDVLTTSTLVFEGNLALTIDPLPTVYDTYPANKSVSVSGCDPSAFDTAVCTTTTILFDSAGTAVEYVSYFGLESGTTNLFIMLMAGPDVTKRGISQGTTDKEFKMTVVFGPNFFPQAGRYVFSVKLGVLAPTLPPTPSPMPTPTPTPMPTPVPLPTCTLSRCHWLAEHVSCDKSATELTLPTTFCGLNETEILEGTIVDDAWVFLAQEYFVGLNNHICTDYTALDSVLQLGFEAALAAAADELSSTCGIISPGNPYAPYGAFISVTKKIRSYIREGLCASEVDTYKYCTPTVRQMKLCGDDGAGVAVVGKPHHKGRHEDGAHPSSYRNVTVDCHLEPYLEDGTGYYEFMASLHVENIDLRLNGGNTDPVAHETTSTPLSGLAIAMIVVGSVVGIVAIVGVLITVGVRSGEVVNTKGRTQFV